MAYKSTPESFVLNAVGEYLTLKKYFFWRTNNGGVYDAKKQIFRKIPKWSIKGVSDFIIVHKGAVSFIEVKAPKKYQSQDQKEFQRRVEAAGCKYYLVRSIDGVIRAGF